MMSGLQTPRLQLRPLGPEDEALYVAAYTDPDVMRHVAPALDPATAGRSFRAACRPGGTRGPLRRWWAMRLRADGAPVGLIGITGEGDEPELGILLLPDRQGQGLAAEAVVALAGHLFDCGGARRIVATHDPRNDAAARLFTAAGFTAFAVPAGVRAWRLDADDQRRHAGPANCGNPATNPLP